MGRSELKQFVKRLAADLGFERCGVASARPVERADYLRAWLDAGRAGSMQYLHRHFSERLDPSRLLEGAKSVIVTVSVYHQPASTQNGPPSSSVPEQPPGRHGRVAMYAWGDDYHRVVKRKLHALADGVRVRVPEAQFRACVDTAPLLEREVAAAAGIGWIGKNTLVLHHELGSYFFLGALVTTLDLPADEPVRDHCGTCTACLDACPTKAFPAPYEMDASRCISYLTIEHRGEIEPDLQPLMGNWLFGCDICQEVCPFNRAAPATREPRYAIRSPGPAPLLSDVLSWSQEAYDRELRGSAARRATLPMWQRNARIALQNATPNTGK